MGPTSSLHAGFWEVRAELERQRSRNDQPGGRAGGGKEVGATGQSAGGVFPPGAAEGVGQCVHGCPCEYVGMCVSKQGQAWGGRGRCWHRGGPRAGQGWVGRAGPCLSCSQVRPSPVPSMLHSVCQVSGWEGGCSPDPGQPQRTLTGCRREHGDSPHPLSVRGPALPRAPPGAGERSQGFHQRPTFLPGSAATWVGEGRGRPEVQRGGEGARCLSVQAGLFCLLCPANGKCRWAFVAGASELQLRPQKRQQVMWGHFQVCRSWETYLKVSREA